MSDEKIAQLSTKDEQKILEAKYMAEEAQKDVKQLRVEIIDIKQEVNRRIDAVGSVVENIRDNHLAHLSSDLNNFKVDVTKGLGGLEKLITENMTNSKWHKTIIWFLISQILVIAFGLISFVITKAIASAL